MTPELLDYLMKLYSYRVKFYQLSDNIDDEIMMKYELFALDAEMVEFLHSLLLGKDAETFSLTVDYNAPLSVTKQQLSDFCSTVTQRIKDRYTTSRTQNPHFDDYLARRERYLPNEAYLIKDFVRNAIDSKVRIDFGRWNKDIQAFKLSKINKMDNKQIAYEMEYVPTTGTYTESQMIYAYNRVASHITHAIQLIQSAERGIFPYIID